MGTSRKKCSLSCDPKALGPQRVAQSGETPPRGTLRPTALAQKCQASGCTCQTTAKGFVQTDSLAEDQPFPYHHPYPAVLVDGLQPLHGYVPDVASPEEDFAWKRDACEPGDSGESCHGTPAFCPLIPLSLGFSAWQLAPECHHLCPLSRKQERSSHLSQGAGGARG